MRVWYGMVWCGMVWCGVVWCGVVWYGMVWYGMVWYGMVCLWTWGTSLGSVELSAKILSILENCPCVKYIKPALSFTSQRYYRTVTMLMNENSLNYQTN